jgi:hypothetical protein
MALQILTPPAAEPLTLAELKLWPTTTTRSCLP